MRKYELEYDEKDIIANPAFRWEMEQKTGQPLSPCVEINGKMLPDVSGEEVEAWMVENGLVKGSEAEPDAPIDASCSPEQHAAQARMEAEEQDAAFEDLEERLKAAQGADLETFDLPNSFGRAIQEQDAYVKQVKLAGARVRNYALAAGAILATYPSSAEQHGKLQRCPRGTKADAGGEEAA